MKKSAVVLAVAAALTASASVHAETTFYGRIAAVLLRDDPDGGDDAWDVQDSGSRWGVRANEDLGNGFSVLARLETAINADRHENARRFDGRLAYVGLSGGFGTFTIGSVWSPYYDAMGAADIFNEAGWYGLAYAGPFRVRNSVRYDTPTLGGFEASLLLNIDNDSQGDADETDTPLGQFEEDGVDQYHLGVRYSAGPFFIGAGYLQDEASDNQQYGLSASFDFAGFSIAAMYERVDPDDSQESNNYYLTAQYKFANNILKAGYGINDPEGDDEFDNILDSDDDRDEWAVGIQHNLSKSARVWVEYADQEDRGELLTIGLRKDW